MRRSETYQRAVEAAESVSSAERDLSVTFALLAIVDELAEWRHLWEWTR